MKYKIGDKVRIRKDLVPGDKYGGVYYVDHMDELKGKEAIITNVGMVAYQLNDFTCWWSEEMFEPVNKRTLLEYALEKLGMTKEELKNEIDRDKEDIEKAKEMVRLNKDAQAYCDSFERVCQGCKVKEFKDKYSRFGRMICTDVFKYLKEKGEI